MAACRTAAAWRCIPAGSKLAGDAGKFTGRDVGGTYHFPGVDPDAAEWLIRSAR